MANNIKFGDVDIQIPSFEIKKFGGLIAIIVVAISVLSSVYTVDANENGVILRLGKYSHTTMPGLQFKIPIIDRVYKVRVDYQHKEEFGFRTERAGVRTKYSTRNFQRESWMLTGDMNIAEVSWIIQYKVKNPVDYLFNVRDVENTIRDVSEATMRLMIGDRSFKEVFSAERVAINDEARVIIQNILDHYKSGISVQMVQLQQVAPPEPVADSYNEVNRAKQEQETLINEANQAYNKEIYRAQGEAQQMINEAEGWGIERVNNALGDASLFEQQLAAYRKAPQITKDRLFIETMNTILGQTPNKIIVDAKLDNLLPLLNLGGKESK